MRKIKSLVRRLVCKLRGHRWFYSECSFEESHGVPDHCTRCGAL